MIVQENENLTSLKLYSNERDRKEEEQAGRKEDMAVTKTLEVEIIDTLI